VGGAIMIEFSSCAGRSREVGMGRSLSEGL
jgi:hypothetical protein